MSNMSPYAQELREPVREVMLKIRSGIITKQAFDPSTSKRHFRIVSADFAITIISQQVGYQSDRTFRRVFKQQMGYSPATYRKIYAYQS